jgi:hypothetical protein
MGSPANAMLRVSVTAVRMHCRGAAASSPRKQQGQVEQLRSVGEARPHAEESTIGHNKDAAWATASVESYAALQRIAPRTCAHFIHGVGPALDPDPGSRDHSP